jgi:hypothetical protein
MIRVPAGFVGVVAKHGPLDLLPEDSAIPACEVTAFPVKAILAFPLEMVFPSVCINFRIK